MPASSAGAVFEHPALLFFVRFGELRSNVLAYLNSFFLGETNEIFETGLRVFPELSRLHLAYLAAEIKPPRTVLSRICLIFRRRQVVNRRGKSRGVYDQRCQQSCSPTHCPSPHRKTPLASEARDFLRASLHLKLKNGCARSQSARGDFSGEGVKKMQGRPGPTLQDEDL